MIGAVLQDKYRIEKKIGQGGFAVVYQGFDTNLKRPVAVKVLTAGEANESFKKRFIRESEALANLSHPNILTVFDCGEYEGKEYLVMELVNGPSLENLITKTHLTLAQACSLAAQICSAMAYAHGQGIIHRDLTLKNIMLDEDTAENARVKILDFGLVKLVHSGVTTTGNAMMGTPSFMAPEQVLGKSTDGRVDIWAFGIGLYRMLCGRFPFVAEHPAALMYLIANEESIDFPDDIPEDLKGIVQQCLQKDPRNRPRDFTELESDLARVQQLFTNVGDLGTTTIQRVSELADRSSKRNPYLNRVMIKNPGDFFGREKEVRKIYSRLDAPQPQSISVVGDRRIGKSSLLNFVYSKKIRKRNMQNYANAIFVYLDFQNSVGFDVKKFIDYLFNIFSFEMDNGSQYTKRPKTLEQLKDAVQELHEKGKRIIILMDEFEIITKNENFEEDFFSFLRSLANSYRVAYVTSSRDELQLMCHNKDISDSPFFNIFSNLPLRPFNREEAMQLITVPSKTEGIPLEQYTGEIIKLAGYFPFYLQIACSNVFEHILDNPGEDPDWQQISKSFMDEVLPHYTFVWEKMEEAERDNLIRTASGKTINRQFQYVSENLLRRGYLIESDEGPKLFSTSFENYVLRQGGGPARKGSVISSLFGKFRGKKNI